MTAPTIRLTDILTDPMDGTPDVGAVLRFTQLTNTGTTLRTAVSELTIDETGLYDITLGYGQVQIEYKTDFQVKDFTILGIVNIGSDTAATTIPELVLSSAPPTDDNILTFQLLLAQTKAAEEAAQGSATNALVSEQAAADSASTASTEASTATSAANTATAAVNAVNVAAGDASASASLAASKAAEADASKIAANSSKVAAQASETASGISETNAANSAQSVSDSASAASTSEVNAKASETAANSSEVAAGNSATSASSSASTATSKASQASASATSASDAADTATSAANTATTKAGEASTSATTASDAASAASLDASVANAQATVAIDKAAVATSQAQIATNKAGEALSSANQAQAITSALPDATDAEIARVQATSTAGVDMVTSEGNVQVALVTAEGTDQTTRVVSAGNTQVHNVEVEGASQIDDLKLEGTVQVTAATNQAGIATTQANIATTKAGESAASAASIADVVSDQDVINAAMTKVEADAIREQNKDLFAQSGFVHFGSSVNTSAVTNINEGLWTRADGQYNDELRGNLAWLGREDTYAGGTSKTSFPVTHIAGVITNILTTDGEAYPFDGSSSTIKFPEAPNGTVTYDSATGTVTQHADSEAAFLYADTLDDIEVVINRHDMFGFKVFLREITDDDPFVYDGGIIQSQATTMSGISTVEDTVRPITYFAVFDGDTGSRGKGVNWSTATNAQKKAIVSDPTNNIYYDAETGKWYQEGLHQTTIRGLGNGDWFNTNSYNGNLEYQSGLPVLSRNGYPYVQSDELGVFEDGHGSYFYVMGKVPRLNSGAYHPSLNSAGCAGYINAAGTGVRYWYNSDRTDVHTKGDCFNFGDYGSDAKVHERTGAIADGLTYRSDGRFYDGIYASGLGGVNDDRMTAWDMGSPEEAAKIQAKVENGTYRGEEKLVRTVPTESTYATSSIEGGTRTNRYAGRMYSFLEDGITYSVVGWLQDAVGNLRPIRTIRYSPSVDQTYVNLADSEGSTNNTANHHLLVGFDTDQTVSGEFEMVTLWGDPAKLLTAHPQGWQGDWGGLGESSPLPLPRKPLSTYQALKSSDGVNWSVVSHTLDSVKNEISVDIAAGDLVQLSHEIYASQTKESSNKPVLNGKAGVMDVYITDSSTPDFGSVFGESLLDKVLTSNIPTNQSICSTLTRISLSASSALPTNSTRAPKHNVLELAAPANNSPAVKVLPYQISNNGQCSLGYQANQLTWDDSTARNVDGLTEFTTVAPLYEFIRLRNSRYTGFFVVTRTYGLASPWDSLFATGALGLGANGDIVQGDDVFLKRVPVTGNWGDDSTIKVTDSGSDTFIDTNGTTNLSVVHELTKPYGATKNRAHAGTQVDGVDV